MYCFSIPMRLIDIRPTNQVIDFRSARYSACRNSLNNRYPVASEVRCLKNENVWLKNLTSVVQDIFLTGPGNEVGNRSKAPGKRLKSQF